MRILVIAVAATLLTGCATWSTSRVDHQNTSQSAPVAAVAPASVVLTTEDITDRSYTSLGDIWTTVNKTTVFHPNPTKEMVNEKLKEEAAKLGADAVILVRYGEVGMGLFSWGSLEGRGRAIRFTK